MQLKRHKTKKAEMKLLVTGRLITMFQTMP